MDANLLNAASRERDIHSDNIIKQNESLVVGLVRMVTDEPTDRTDLTTIKLS